MSEDQAVTQAVIDSVVKHACKYFMDEMEIEALPGAPFSGDIKSLSVRDIIAIIGLGGPVSLLVAFSFDRSLLEAMFTVATAGLDIAEDERETFMREVAAETINVVLGHSTADLSTYGNNVTLSPPVLIEDASKVHKPRGAYFTTVTITTGSGSFDIDFIAPKHLFKASLNEAAV